MIRVCAWCGKFMGFRRPLLDFSRTHGICQKCAAEYKKEVKHEQVNQGN